MKDTRTPYFHEGIQELRKAGYQPIVRNAGGLGIISDQGVLNISLIFPQNEQEKISIDAAYEKNAHIDSSGFSNRINRSF